MSLKLNSISSDIFVSHKGNQTAGISRDDLVAGGRLVAMEYAGRMTNMARNSKEYTPVLKDQLTYATMAQGHKEKLMMFCAACAYAQQGKQPPSSYQDVVNDVSLQRNGTFLATMAGVVKEVITPLLPYTIANAGGMLLEVTTVPMGQTKEITVRSNDVFLFEDSAPGSNRSASMNYLYDGTVTLNPRWYTANATIKWYQMVANDTDIGWYYNAIMAGMYSKIMALYTQAITGLVDNTKYIPSYLQADGYNTANWANLTVGVSTANGVPRTQLMAFGEYRSLQKVLPSGTAQDAALTYGLGQEWMKNGFLGTVSGVPLFEVMNAMVPGTVNTTGQFVYPDDLIIIAGRPGTTYAPIYAAFAEGSPLTLELNPSQSGAPSIDISVSAIMDVKVVMGSKIGIIENVT